MWSASRPNKLDIFGMVEIAANPLEPQLLEISQ
jgi:hypothetical protein